MFVVSSRLRPPPTTTTHHPQSMHPGQFSWPLLSPSNYSLVPEYHPHPYENTYLTQLPARIRIDSYSPHALLAFSNPNTRIYSFIEALNPPSSFPSPLPSRSHLDQPWPFVTPLYAPPLASPQSVMRHTVLPTDFTNRGFCTEKPSPERRRLRTYRLATVGARHL